MNITKSTGILGIAAFVLFSLSLLIFGSLNREFEFLNDFISKLGAKDEPYAYWWNIIGFGAVGIIFLVFGMMYGSVIKDKLTGTLLSLFGLGFALTGIPMDMVNDRSTVSKAHIAAICLGLASWLFGLARMGYNPLLSRIVKLRANVAATLLAISMIGFAIQLWSMPITHRLVFTIVFGWTLITSIGLLQSNHSKKTHNSIS